MNLIFRYLFLFLFLILCDTSYAYVGQISPAEVHKHDATKNAYYHSNMGNIYFNEKNYVSALSEYKIALMLSKNSKTSAIYLYNIANCFMKLNQYNEAKNAILKAIDNNYMNLSYYDSLAKCYVILGEAQQMLSDLLYDIENPYNRLLAGFIYLHNDELVNAKIIFDEFVSNYPDMIITQDVVSLLKTME